MDASINALVVLAELFAAVAIVSIVAAAVLGSIAMYRHATATTDVMKGLIQTGSIIRLATILAIVAALVTLSVLGKVSGDSAVAALSGIAGYVLGGERLSRQRQDETDASKKV